MTKIRQGKGHRSGKVKNREERKFLLGALPENYLDF
jgi:hypothetical protein